MSADNRPHVGWVENALIFPDRLPIKVKLDTGAKTASLDVEELVEFDNRGEKWVRFALKGKAGEMIWFEKPVVKESKIRRAGASKQSRPVVRLGVCIGASLRSADVNLTSRTGMNYRMLIGRDFLSGHFLVDPSATYLTKPQCSGVHKGQ